MTIIVKMEKIFTSEKIVRKYKRLKLLSVVLLIVGVLILVTELVAGSGKGTFQALGTLVDNLFLFFFSAYLYVFSRNKLKKVSGKQLIFKEDEVLFHTGSEVMAFNGENKPESIEIKLKGIKILTGDNCEVVVNLDDFSTDTMTRREIKAHFEKFKEKFHLPGDS